MAVSSVASAVTPPPPDGGRGAVLQNQLEKQIPQPNALPTPGPKEEPGRVEDKAKTDEQTVVVKVFKTDGVTAFTPDEIQKVLAPWLNRPLTLLELQDAADAVAKFYSDHSLMAQVEIPPQKIQPEEGEVTLKVIEVRLGAVNVNELDPKTRMAVERIKQYITTGNPLGELLNSSAIERSTLILKETPGISVTTELEPGTSDGEVALKVNATGTPIYNGMVAFSNAGSASNGQNQTVATLGLNNLTGIGDGIHINGSHTEGSSLGSLSLSVPLTTGGWGLGLSASAMHYATIGDYAGSLGTSHTYGATLTYPLIRSQATNLNFSLAYDLKFYKNTTAAGSIVSDYRVNDVTTTISGNHFDGFLGGGITTVSLAWVRGHWMSNSWDPAVTTNYGEYDPDNYGKLTFALARIQQIIQDQLTLSINLSGQFAFNNLDGGEKFYLGGSSGVRAYPASQGGGDSGALLQFELQHPFIDGIQGSLFLDGGYVRQYKNAATYDLMVAPNTSNARNIYYLAGGGLGLKYAQGAFSGSATMAWPIGINPLFGYSSTQLKYVQQNSDHTSGHPYFWFQAAYAF